MFEILNYTKINKQASGIFVSILVFCLCSCTSTPVHAPDEVSNNVSSHVMNEETYWWYCRFKVSWPEDTGVDLVVDLMLAHAVVGPVLKKYEQDILYWRFHRRAVRDGGGHQFSFIFYTDTEIATRIMTDLRSSELLQQALSENVLERIHFDEPANPTRPNIDDASDKNWSIEIRRNWPAFIMGVSSTWLGLIDDVMTDTPAIGDISKLIEQYKQTESTITSMWNSEGLHAFMHHLSAIFGYEQLLIRF